MTDSHTCFLGAFPGCLLWALLQVSCPVCLQCGISPKFYPITVQGDLSLISANKKILSLIFASLISKYRIYGLYIPPVRRVPSENSRLRLLQSLFPAHAPSSL